MTIDFRTIGGGPSIECHDCGAVYDRSIRDCPNCELPTCISEAPTPIPEPRRSTGLLEGLLQIGAAAFAARKRG